MKRERHTDPIVAHGKTLLLLADSFLIKVVSSSFATWRQPYSRSKSY